MHQHAITRTQHEHARHRPDMTESMAVPVCVVRCGPAWFCDTRLRCCVVMVVLLSLRSALAVRCVAVCVSVVDQWYSCMLWPAGAGRVLVCPVSK